MSEQPFYDDLLAFFRRESGIGPGEKDLGHPSLGDLALEQVFAVWDSHG